MTRPALCAVGGLAIVAVFLAGCLLGRAYRRTDKIIDTTTVETTVYLRRQDTQVLHAEHRITAWRTRVVERPDGTKETETETREERDTKTDTHTKTDESATESKQSTNTTRELPRWTLGAFGSISRHGLGYGPLLGYRLAGPLWVAGAIDLRNKLGILSLSLSF